MSGTFEKDVAGRDSGSFKAVSRSSSGRIADKRTSKRAKTVAVAAPIRADVTARVEVRWPLTPIEIPHVKGEVTLGEKTGVVVDKEEWDDLIDRLEDLEALKVFEQMKDEPPEAFVSVAEVKRRLWSNNIKEVRKGKGVTQVELARSLGCKQSYISKLEHPDYRPEVSTLERVADALGIEVTELIWRGRRSVSMAKKPRDTYKYQFKVRNKIVHGGITDDLERREAEHQEKWPKGHIKQVGRQTTEDAARKWEEEKGYS